MDKGTSRLELRNALIAGLYEKYREKVSAKVKSKIGGETPEADDIVSDIFLALVEFISGSSYRREASLGSVLYRITENKIMDHLRKKYRTKPTNFTPEEIVNIASLDMFASSYENRALFDRIMKKIYILTPRQRAAFLLHGVAGLPVKEVADRMELSESRVNKLYDRARERLKVKLQTIWEETTDNLEARQTKEDLGRWIDKAFGAYGRLGQKIGHWDEGIALAAETAKRKIQRLIREAQC